MSEMADNNVNPAKQTAQVGQLLIKEQVPIKAFIMSIMRRPDAAEDVFQQVAIVVLEKAQDFELGTNFRSWAMSIARFSCLEYIRKRSHKTFASSELVDLLAEESVESTEDPHQMVEALHECMKLVPEEGRNVLKMRYVDGKPVEAISEFVNRTMQGTYALIKRLKGKIRDCLQRKTGFSAVPSREG